MSKSLEIGLVGLPNVGKSTVFNALTKNNILAANYPFATIDPNIGIVNIRDNKLNKLANLYNTNKIIPATIKFIDIAGLVEGSSSGEGMGNQFLAHIRECNAICQVVRVFEDSNVTHVNNKTNPKHDIEIINTELVLADLQTIEKRINSLEKLAKSDQKAKELLGVAKLAKENLDKNTPLFNVKDLDLELLRDLNLLTAKPIIYIFNIDDQTINDEPKKDELKKIVSNSPAIFVNAKLESELNDLDEQDSKELLNSYGQKKSGLNQLINAAYDILGLQSFLTAGAKEVRAWTVKKGATAPQAAGVIHTDFERGFIAAEIVKYHDLINTGSLANARAEGLVRTEGKTYIMQPDDVVEFRFNV